MRLKGAGAAAVVAVGVLLGWTGVATAAPTGALAVAAGSAHSCAIRGDDATVVCWGTTSGTAPSGGVRPQKLWPQQSTPESASRTAQVWRPAAATAVNRPAGTSPDVWPQQVIVASSARMAQECADPDATAAAPVGAATATPHQPRSTPTAIVIAVPAIFSLMRVPSLVEIPQ